MDTVGLTQLTSFTRARLDKEVAELSKAAENCRSIDYVLGGPNFPTDLLSRSLIFILHRLYGANSQTIDSQLRRLVSLGAQFAKLYGEGPVSVLRAPARINILGEHVDYVSYLPTVSLPFGSREHDMLMMYRNSDTDFVRGASTQAGYSSFAFPLNDGPGPGVGISLETDWAAFLFAHPAGAPHWSNYVKGAAFFARLTFGRRIERGFDFVVDSAIPAGGGASSSSALVVLASAAVRACNRVAYSPLELAHQAAKAEWYVGTRGGAMDHLTICLGKRDHAVLIRYLDQRARPVALPGGGVRWVTFFSEAADKGRAVMIEYNERAAVSRIVLPRLIEEWKAKKPDRYQQWLSAIRLLESGGPGALDEIELLLQELPRALTLTEIGREYPEAFAACARSFPALVAERAERPLPLRARALHHVGEVRRVNAAAQALEVPRGSQSRPEVQQDQEIDTAMRLIGTLLDQSHASLRDLYEVSTPEVERLVEIIRASPGVYGARLMGGGFGGNVLALTRLEQVESLIERVQENYYEPRGRLGLKEGSVMVSTPGDGLARISVEGVWREVIEDFNSSGRDSTKYRDRVNVLLDTVGDGASQEDLWTVIVAAGKGTRSRASGLAVPKPLAVVSGVPAILHVWRSVRTAFGQTRRPIVIVSPETEGQLRALLKEEVTFVVQPEALGTGDAVLRAREQLEGFHGRVQVVWSTQPVIRPETMRRTLKLAKLFADYEMVVPTAHQERPYAPLLRDERGKVQSARETHLEQADHLLFGESNVGMFILKSEAMFKALADLRQQLWNESERRYRRQGGELGFPNELINYFAGREKGVFACPIADSREEQGIKTLPDVARCEQFISELAEE